MPEHRARRPRARHRLLRLLFAAALATGLALPAVGRSAAPEAVVTVDDVHFHNYGVQDGLSQTTVRSMLQDPTGAVWIGTQDGLNRFDGYEFKVYRADPQRADSLPDSYVQALTPSQRGGFWVGTKAAGIALYDPERDRFTRFSTGEANGGNEANAVTALQETADGRLWVGNSGDGLQWLDPGSKWMRWAPDTLNRQFGSIAAMTLLDGRLLVGGKDGLWVVDGTGQSAQRWGRSGEDLRVECIEISPDGREVWVGTRFAGLFRFDRDGRQLGRWSTAEGLPHVNVRDLVFDRQGRLWITTLEGLARLESLDKPLRVWTYGAGLGGSLASDRLQSLLVDRDGLVWVGTWLNGVSIFAPQTEVFQEVQVRARDAGGGKGLAVGSFLVDPDGSMWMSAAEGLGLVHYDFRRGVLAQYPPDPGNPRALPSNIILDIRRDRLGRLWVSTAAGLARLEGDGFKVFRHDPKDSTSLPSPNGSALLEDRNGAMWVGTLGGGLGMLCDGCTTFRNYRVLPSMDGRPGLGGSSVETLYEDKQGAIWIGLRSAGLARLDPRTDRIEHYRARPGVAGRLGNDSVTWIGEDREGRLWVGHGAGISRATPDASGSLYFQNYSTNAVGGVVQDDDGHFWISTTVGISRLDAATGQFTHFGARDGAQLMGYFISASGRFPDGRIAFGGVSGVTVFDPRKVSAMSQTYRVTLTAMNLARANAVAAADVWGQWMRGVRAGQREREVVLPPDGDDLSLEFSAMAFMDPQGVRYAYRMDGVNEDWVEVDARRRLASYNNLGPGRYTFRVRARGAYGAWGPELVIPLRLTPPWWRTWMAYLGYALVAALLLGGLAWEVRQRLSERKRAQRDIAESEQRLKLALWGTGDELWDLDLAKGQLRRQNPLDVVEAVEVDVVGGADAMRALVHPDDLSTFDAAIAAHLAGDKSYLEVSYRVRDASGHWRWLLSRGRVVARDANGRALRLTGTNSDITRLKEHELELAKINVELESRVHARTEALHASNDHLQHTIDELRDTQRQLVESEKMAALGGLVAGVAHEINTPLGVGVTAASYLSQEANALAARIASGTLDEAGLAAFSSVARESAQLILRNLQRADRMVKSFKQVAVDQSSEGSRTIELPGYLEEILLSLQPMLRQRRHEVVIDCARPITFETFPGAIYQIISNLVMNSVMHGFADRENGHIRIAMNSDERDVVLTYEDDGCGMNEEARRRVFEPFFTTRRGRGGSGLGMHIVWNLATKVLGGSISCDTTRDHGTSFVLRIPRQLRPHGEASWPAT